MERGVSVKPEPEITICSSTSDLSAGQHETPLSAPAPGSRVSGGGCGGVGVEGGTTRTF